jgi:L-threonylcarbamoyladenylate synthase
MGETFEDDLEQCLGVLRSGGIILYPTDTVWGIGCDATNAEAVQRIFALKERDDKKSMIILVADENDILQHVAAPDPSVTDYIEAQDRPTTIIFDGAVGLPDNLVGQDGSIALRVVKDRFCRHLIKRLRRPLVSTSANRSGENTPPFFSAISTHIRDGVDYVVKHRRDERGARTPSRIVKWQRDGNHTVIRG